MKVGIIGTGMVGRANATKLAGMGHEVMVGTRDIIRKLAELETDAMGNPPFAQWLEQNPKVKLGTFAEAAAFGEMVINATHGMSSLAALKLAGEQNLAGKVLIDLANELDFSQGMPPKSLARDEESLGERIQKAFARAKVVKTLNTVNAVMQVDPGQLAGADHSIFMSGNDEDAKTQVARLLESYGWRDIIDLGDITSARGTEMLIPIWLRLWGMLGTPVFNYKIVR